MTSAFLLPPGLVPREAELAPGMEAGLPMDEGDEALGAAGFWGC